MVRDSQKAALYAAERECGLGWEQGYQLDLPAAQAFIDRVLARKHIRRMIPVAADVRVRVVDWPRARHGRANADLGRIQAPDGARSEGYLLHELGHILAELSWPSIPIKHGPGFVQIQLILIRNVLGVATHEQLRRAFLRHGVRSRREPIPRTVGLWPGLGIEAAGP